MDLSLPRGIRDIEPEEFALHETIRDAFYDIAKLFNFKIMEPAPIENLAVLRAKSGEQIDREIYSFKDKAGRDIGLRFDLTVGITRYVCSRRDLKMPIKLACFGDVWRYDEPQYARYRWFHQWDLEVYGVANVEADAEVIEASYRFFEKLNLGDIAVNIGDRRVVEEYISKQIKVDSKERVIELMRALDKVQRKTKEELEREYLAKGFKREDLGMLFKFGSISGEPDDVIAKLDELHLDSADGMKMLRDSLIARNIRKVNYNLSIVRGIDYYTSIVFEITDLLHPELGSLCGGGRYDLLPKVFGRPELSATGAAGGVERIALSLKGRSLGKKVPVVYVAYSNEKYFREAERVASIIRGKGVCTELPLQAKSLTRQLEDANQANARWVIIIGQKEIESGRLTLHDMSTGKEDMFELDKLISQIIC